MANPMVEGYWRGLVYCGQFCLFFKIWFIYTLGRDTLGESELGDGDDIPIEANVPGENDIATYDENSINSSTDNSGKMFKQNLKVWLKMCLYVLYKTWVYISAQMG